jgi:hypothetical protein
MFTVAAISAKEDRHLMTTDVPAAYINEKMNPSMAKVHMHIDAANTALLPEIKPEWPRYVGENGTIAVQLERALYGLIEIAKLWYEEFSVYLKRLGFIANAHDPCVFNKDFNGKQCTLVLYVDDCFVDCEDPAVEENDYREVWRMYPPRWGCITLFGSDDGLNRKGSCYICDACFCGRDCEECQSGDHRGYTGRKQLILHQRDVLKGREPYHSEITIFLIIKDQSGPPIAGKLPVYEGAGTYRRWSKKA